LASADRAAIPFGLRRPTPEQIGLLARRLMEEADAAIRRARPRALLLLAPFLGFYVLYTGLLALVLWGLSIHLDPSLFLGFTALVFAAMAVLGRYYRAGEMEMEGDMPRMLAVMVLQAYILRGFTWFIFVIPYLAFRNLTRLFPRRARVSPEILEAAAQIGVALDVPVTARQLTALLPRALPAPALAEALVLLEWAGMVVTHPRGGDTVVQPGPAAGGLLAALPQSADIVTLSMILAAPSTPDLPEEEPEAAPLPTPKWLRPLADRPGLAMAAGLGGIVALWILVALGHSWYRHLPVELERPLLPNVGDATGLSFAEGRFVVCLKGGVNLHEDLAAPPEESYELTGLLRTELHLRTAAPIAPAFAEGESGDEGSMVWDTPEEPDVRVSFGPVYSAVPDPGGRHLLVYGEWRCQEGQGVSCGRTGMGVVDLEEETFTPEEQFRGWALKGWWEEGTLLAVQASQTWEQGGGGSVESSNLSGRMAALDPATGKTEEIHPPKHAFFGLARTEEGRRVFLGADWQADEIRMRAACTFTEYREFQKVRSFSLTLKQFRPFLIQARLDATGQYWILAFGSVPGLMEMDKGTLYTVWIVSRGGGRGAQVLESRRDATYMIGPFAYQGRSMFSLLTGANPPAFSVREIRR